MLTYLGKLIDFWYSRVSTAQLNAPFSGRSAWIRCAMHAAPRQSFLSVTFHFILIFPRAPDNFQNIYTHYMYTYALYNTFVYCVVHVCSTLMIVVLPLGEQTIKDVGFQL